MTILITDNELKECLENTEYVRDKHGLGIQLEFDWEPWKWELVSDKNTIEQVEKLYCNYEQSTDISWLEHFTNLKYLNLSWNEITDITPLAKLTSLEKLDLSENQIENLAPLANLTNLTHLSLLNNNIKDITILANLTNLENLWLSENRITDVSPVTYLTKLRRLWLDNNRELKVLPWSITNLTNLIELNLDGTELNKLAVSCDEYVWILTDKILDTVWDWIPDTLLTIKWDENHIVSE